MCTEFNMPLAKKVWMTLFPTYKKLIYLIKAFLKRNPNEGQEIKRLWNELGTNVSEIRKFRAIYTANELLGKENMLPATEIKIIF